jgi:hypothetical protein
MLPAGGKTLLRPSAPALHPRAHRVAERHDRFAADLALYQSPSPASGCRHLAAHAREIDAVEGRQGRGLQRPIGRRGRRW